MNCRDSEVASERLAGNGHDSLDSDHGAVSRSKMMVNRQVFRCHPIPDSEIVEEVMRCCVEHRPLGGCRTRRINHHIEKIIVIVDMEGGDRFRVGQPGFWVGDDDAVADPHVYDRLT